MGTQEGLEASTERGDPSGGDDPVRRVSCPNCGAVEGHIMGVVIRGVYDGVLFWSCTLCFNAWHRWPKGHHLHDVAVEYVVSEQAPWIGGPWKGGL